MLQNPKYLSWRALRSSSIFFFSCVQLLVFSTVTSLTAVSPQKQQLPSLFQTPKAVKNTMTPVSITQLQALSENCSQTQLPPAAGLPGTLKWRGNYLWKGFPRKLAHGKKYFHQELRVPRVIGSFTQSWNWNFTPGPAKWIFHRKPFLSSQTA